MSRRRNNRTDNENIDLDETSVEETTDVSEEVPFVSELEETPIEESVSVPEEVSPISDENPEVENIVENVVVEETPQESIENPVVTTDEPIVEEPVIEEKKQPTVVTNNQVFSAPSPRKLRYVCEFVTVFNNKNIDTHLHRIKKALGSIDGIEIINNGNGSQKIVKYVNTRTDAERVRKKASTQGMLVYIKETYN